MSRPRAGAVEVPVTPRAMQLCSARAARRRVPPASELIARTGGGHGDVPYGGADRACRRRMHNEPRLRRSTSGCAVFDAPGLRTRSLVPVAQGGCLNEISLAILVDGFLFASTAFLEHFQHSINVLIR